MVGDVRPTFHSEREAIRAVAGILGIHDPELLYRWVRHSATAGSKWNLVKKSLFSTHTVAVGVAVTVLGGLGLAYSQQFFGAGQSVQLSPTGSTQQGPRLEVDAISLSYGSPKQATPLDIDIKLLNAGRHLAAINSVGLVIQKAITLPVCTAQGDFPSTGTYPANVPAILSPGRSVNIPVSQLVPPDGADRFDVVLRSQMPESGDIYLYLARMYLTYNTGTDPLSIGQVVIALPAAPGAGGYFWSTYWAAHVAEFVTLTDGKPGAEACDIRNSHSLHSLHSLLSLSVAQPTQFAAITSQLAY
jgi:hypothetical protein